MELIDVYTSDLDNYTLQEFIMEHILGIGRNIECKEDVYKEVSVLTETNIDDAIAYLNHYERPPKKFLERLGYYYDVKHEQLKSICRKIISNKRREQKRKANANEVENGRIAVSLGINRFKRDASNRHHDKMEMYKRANDMIPEGTPPCERYGILAEKLGKQKHLGKSILERLRDWERLYEKYGRVENSIPAIQKLLKDGNKAYKIARFLGAGCLTVRKIERKMKEKQSPLDKQA